MFPTDIAQHLVATTHPPGPLFFAFVMWLVLRSLLKIVGRVLSCVECVLKNRSSEISASRFQVARPTGTTYARTVGTLAVVDALRLDSNRRRRGDDFDVRGSHFPAFLKHLFSSISIFTK
jgi:hypothetical protein